MCVFECNVSNNLVFKVEGYMIAVYNLGEQDIVVKDSSVRVNDGKYHVVRFTRDGVNSSLQVDDNKVSVSSTDTRGPDSHSLYCKNLQKLEDNPLQIQRSFHN